MNQLFASEVLRTLCCHCSESAVEYCLDYAQEMLRKLERNPYHALIRRNPDRPLVAWHSIVGTHAPGRIIDATGAFCRIIGYPYDHLCRLTTKDLTDATVWHSMNGDLSRIRRLLAQQGGGSLRTKLVRADGVAISVELRTTAVFRNLNDLYVLADLSSTSDVSKVRVLDAKRRTWVRP